MEMTRLKSFLIAASCAPMVLSLAAHAATHTVSSPDGAIQVHVSDDGGELRYRVNRKEKIIIQPSSRELMPSYIAVSGFLSSLSTQKKHHPPPKWEKS